MGNQILQAALSATANGISTVPVSLPGKTPTVDTWKWREERIPDEKQIRLDYRGANGNSAVAIIGGKVSGDIEFFDFDILGEFFKPFIENVEAVVPGLIGILPLEKTLNDGFHLLIKCPAVTIPGSQKLASKKVEFPGPGRHKYCGKGYDSKREGDRFFIYPGAIETKAEGGYIVCAPSPGYSIIHPGENGDFFNIPTITEAERETLLRCARTLDQEPPEVATVRNGPKATTGEVAGIRPGDDFNQRGDVTPILLKHGCKPAGGTPERQQWTRPGKLRGISFTIYDCRVMRMFSSNFPPFEMDTNYSAYAINAMLEHGSDFSAAARALRRDGYGDQPHTKNAAATPSERNSETPLEESHRKSYHLSDTGNGERFADNHREDVRFCFPANRWSVWDKLRWKQDNEGIIMQLAKRTTRAIYHEARKEPDPEKSQKIGKWAAASESSFRQVAMIRMAQSEPGIPILPEQMDAYPMLLNVKNGIIDLSTGALLPHDKSLLLTKIVNVDYNPDALCPRWLEFLETVTAGDAPLVDYLCRVAGYTLTGHTGEQCFFLLYGTGQNGKSTFLNVLQTILNDYAMQTGFNTFVVKKGDAGIRNDIARLKSARMVTAVESGDGNRLDEQVIKQMTGSDKVNARFLYQEEFDYKPEYKIFLAANQSPDIHGQDDGIWRRVKKIPFTVKIPTEKLIQDYEKVLLEEAEGILNWMVFGALEWQKMGGLRQPATVENATSEYRSEQDVLKDFLNTRCVFGSIYRVTHSDLYENYTGWCEAQNEKPFKTRTISKMLENRGFKYVKPKNVKTWIDTGIKQVG